MEGLGARLRKSRSANGLTLQQLEDASGVSKSYIWRIEKSGEKGETVRPSGDTLSKFADALGVSVGELTGREVDQGRGRSVRRVTRVTLPVSLKKFLEECRSRNQPLPESEVFMLSVIQHKGKRPKTVDDWRFIYEAIKRVV